MNRQTIIRAPRRFETPRLVLEAPAPEHAAAVCDSVNTSLPTLGFIHWAQSPWTLERAIAFCQGGLKQVDKGTYLVFHAFRKEDRAYVGRIDLHSFDLETPRAEVGYVGDIRHAGQGLMREATLGVVQFGFDLGFARIEAISEVDNHRAQRFAESLGFQREATLHHRERDARGELCDQVMWAAFPGKAPVADIQVSVGSK